MHFCIKGNECHNAHLDNSSHGLAYISFTELNTEHLGRKYLVYKDLYNFFLMLSIKPALNMSAQSDLTLDRLSRNV